MAWTDTLVEEAQSLISDMHITCNVMASVRLCYLDNECVTPVMRHLKNSASAADLGAHTVGNHYSDQQ